MAKPTLRKQFDHLQTQNGSFDSLANSEDSDPELAKDQTTLAEFSSGGSGNYRQSYLVYVAVLCCHMASICMGSAFGWSAPALEEMANNETSEWISPVTPTDQQKSIIASILTLGSLIGGFFCGFFMNYFGRKKTLIALGIPYAIGWTLIGLSKSIAPILIGRVITGMSIGVTTAVVPTYIAEVSPPRIRGLLGMTFNFFVVFGIVYIDLIYIFNFHWNQLALWALLPSGLLIFTMMLMPESPSWFVNNISDTDKAVQRAMASLRRLRSQDSDIHGELRELLNNRSSVKQSKLQLSFSTVTRPDVYKPFLIGMTVLFFQQFCGINAVMFFSNDIFRDSGSTLAPKTSTLICNLFMLFATIIGGFIIDRFGRRVLLVISALGMGASIGVLGYYYYVHRHDLDTNMITTVQPVINSWNLTTTMSPISEVAASNSGSLLPIICVSFYVSSFSLGMGPISWILITEITPPQTIGLISSTSSMFAWIWTFLVVNEAAVLTKVLTTYGTYWLFSGICVFCILFAYFLPETKGKSMEEIITIFKY